VALVETTGTGMTAPIKFPHFLILAVAIATAIAGTMYFRSDPTEPSPVTAPMIALEKMGKMISLKVNYSDVIEFSEKSAIDLPFNREIRLGSTRALLIAKGDCTIGTDLTRAKYEKIDKGNTYLLFRWICLKLYQFALITMADRRAAHIFMPSMNMALPACLVTKRNAPRLQITRLPKLRRNWHAFACQRRTSPALGRMPR
jgi:hypothetical protein